MRERIEKLRAMAEHPTSNPHEAAIARGEMERLIREHPEQARLSWSDVGHERFRVSWLQHKTHMDQFRERFGKRPVQWDIEDPFVPSDTSADRVAFARNLKIGEQARTRHSTNWLIYDGPVLRSELLTLSRRTKSGILVMSDGSRFNLNGYKRGETGRDGHRTYLVKP